MGLQTGLITRGEQLHNNYGVAAFGSVFVWEVKVPRSKTLRSKLGGRWAYNGGGPIHETLQYTYTGTRTTTETIRLWPDRDYG